MIILEKMMKKRTFFFVIALKWKACVLVITGLLLIITVSTLSVRTYLNFSSPLKEKSILIDAGHGGIDGGTSHKDILEKNITLEISLRLKELLTQNDASVGMTRETDISLDNRNQISTSRHTRDLYARVSMINSGNFHAFVSLHVNHTGASRAMGPLVFYNPQVKESQSLAEYIQKRLNSVVQQHVGSNKLNRMPLKADYYILKNAKIPGVIVEAGFLSNSIERSLLVQQDYQEKLAAAIFEGIADFYRTGMKPVEDFGPDSPDVLPDLEEVPFEPMEDIKVVEQ